MANKTNIKKGILDFDYIKALNIIDPNYLNKIFITFRGGNSNHVNSEADWYKINNTNLLVNLYLDHNKKKLYALSISKIPKNNESGGNIENIDNNVIVPSMDYRKKNKSKSKKHYASKSPEPQNISKSPGRPRKKSKSPRRPRKSSKTPERPRKNMNVHQDEIKPELKDSIKQTNHNDMYNVDYEDVDEYGGNKKKRGRKPRPPSED